MESTVVEEYGSMPGNENGRVIRGQMVVGGERAYPFVIQAIHAGVGGLPGGHRTRILPTQPA